MVRLQDRQVEAFKKTACPASLLANQNDDTQPRQKADQVLHAVDAITQLRCGRLPMSIPPWDDVPADRPFAGNARSLHESAGRLGGRVVVVAADEAGACPGARACLCAGFIQDRSNI